MSVEPTLLPYNPMVSHAGIPAEEVRFSVTHLVGGQFSCIVEVVLAGKLLGSTTIGIGPPAHARTLAESASVMLNVETFAGTPATARVQCHGAGQPAPTR